MHYCACITLRSSFCSAGTAERRNPGNGGTWERELLRELLLYFIRRTRYCNNFKLRAQAFEQTHAVAFGRFFFSARWRLSDDWDISCGKSDILRRIQNSEIPRIQLHNRHLTVSTVAEHCAEEDNWLSK